MNKKNYLDFGDVVTLKKENILKRMKETGNPNIEEVKDRFNLVSFFKFEFLKNKLGMLDIKETCYDENNVLIHLNDLKRNIILKDIFHFVDLGLANVKKSNTYNIPNTIETKVNISDKVQVGDGDLFTMKTEKFIEMMKVSKIAKNKVMLKFLEEALRFGLNKIIFHFSYEDGRKSASWRSYLGRCAPNPYSDMVVDLYVTNDEMSMFGKMPLDSKNSESYQENFKKESDYFQHFLMSYKNKTELFNEVMEECQTTTERFHRTDFNTVLVLNENKKIEDELMFLGNFYSKEKDFISTHELILLIENNMLS